VQTTLIPVGGSAIVEFTVDVPGTYAIVDHSLFRAFNKGAVGQLIVEGEPAHATYSGKQFERNYTPPVAENTGPIVVQESVGDIGPLDDAGRMELGKATYNRLCAACHQPQGQGIPGTYPPLASSDYLASAPPEKLIGHIVNGLQGPITVNGTPFNAVMPPMAFLTNDEISGALSYVRANFGNKLGAIQPGDVEKVRGAK
jgi:nitrite reductase (NO-forming)